MLGLHQQITDLLDRAGIFLTDDEINNLELADFGLNDFSNIGLIIHTYINTERCCAKELVMLPNQLCPEHEHPSIAGQVGKEETFRCRYGAVSIFIAGERTEEPCVEMPIDQSHYTVFHEVVLHAGDQLTLLPDRKHWFKAHESGAVLSEFSTHSDDASDIFTDPNINRASRYCAG